MLKKWVIKQLVQKNSEVDEQYYEYVRTHPSKAPADMWNRWKKLQEIKAEVKRSQDEEERICYSYGVSIEEIEAQLEHSEAVSFDIFDTLLFRYFDRPVDVFLYMEAKYKFPNFQKLRIDAEKKARQLSESDEINIYDIYQVLKRECSLDVEEWVSRELQAELEVCFPNPYMKEVFERLKVKKKKIYIISDMYLPAQLMRQLLEYHSYTGFEELLVSCDYKCSKADGKLFEIALRKMRISSEQVTHIGDNKHSDVIMPKRLKWNAIYYPNVNKNRKWHKISMSPMVGGIYRGIVNAHLNCGAYTESEYYQYGYLAGGLLTYGYCQWIEDIVKQYSIDKVLFLARDGYVIQKVFQQLFTDIPNEYVYFSRFCAQQIMFEKDTNMYIQQTIVPRAYAKQLKTIRESLEELGLEFLLPSLKEDGQNVEEILNKETLKNVEQLIYQYKPLISKRFREASDVAYQYYKNVLGEAKKVLIVDLGWFGTCSIGLTQLLNERMFGKVETYSVLVGTSANPAVDARLANHELEAYAFSTRKNRFLMEWHMGQDTMLHNILVEVLYTATHPSFLHFLRQENGDIRPVFGYKEQKNQEAIKEIQKGIEEFAKQWNSMPNDLKKFLAIEGEDAYAPVKNMLQKRKICYNIFKDYEINELSGKFSKATISTIGALMEEYKYIEK